jgi:hypothetical protein
MDFGTIVSIEIAVNLDTGENVRLAKVRAVGDDLVTVELPMNEGVEFCPAVNDVIYYEEIDPGYLLGRYVQSQLPVDDSLTDGEQEIYARSGSGDNANRASKVTLKSDGTLIFNDGTDFGVRFDALESSLSDLVDDMNKFFAFAVNHSHTSSNPGVLTAGTVPDPAAVPPTSKPTGSSVTLDMSSAKAEKVKL